MSFLDRAEPFLLGVSPGSGLTASRAAEAQASFLLALTAGLFRNQGVGSLASFLPFGNANAQTCELMVRHILPQAGTVPVVAGIMAVDRDTSLEEWLAKYRSLGVTGVTNWPPLGFTDGSLRACLEEEGWSLEAEVGMLQQAHAMGFSTLAFVFSEEEAIQFAAAGVEALILNLGLTRPEGNLASRQDQINHAGLQLNRMRNAVTAAGFRPFFLAFGGVITSSEDLRQLLRTVQLDGFAGGSVFERLPVEDAVASTLRAFSQAAWEQQSTGEQFGIVGRSRIMLQLYRSIEKLAGPNVNVCLEGETGTGKELIATLLHRRGPRSNQPFVTLNCGAIPETLLESELFGHEKGAFTGAVQRRLGKFELAHRGTLFLDEIADLSLRGQVALLRAIQQREIVRVGGDRPVPVDVRLITATHQKLDQLVEEGRFRADLYYRLNSVTLEIPPLRERKEDIPLLAEHWLRRLRNDLNRPRLALADSFGRKLIEHAWPGNVRELQHVLTRAAVFEESDLLRGNSFVPARERKEEKFQTSSQKRRAAQQAMERNRGNKSLAARELGVTRKTLYGWLRG